MTSVKELNEITSNILLCENKIESLEFAIKKISEGARVDAKLEIDLDGRSRNSRTEYLTKEEVAVILESRLSEHKGFLADFQKQFEQMQ